MGNIFAACAPKSASGLPARRNRSEVGLSEEELQLIMDQERREQKALLRTTEKSDDINWTKEMVIRSEYLDKRAAREHKQALKHQKRLEKELKRRRQQQKRALDQRRRTTDDGSFSANLNGIVRAYTVDDCDLKSTASVKSSRSLRSTRSARSTRSNRSNRSSNSTRSWMFGRRVRSDVNHSVITPSGNGGGGDDEEELVVVNKYIRVPVEKGDLAERVARNKKMVQV